MDRVLKELSPSLVFKYFEEITRIPRESGNEKAVSDYLVNFAREHKLQVIQDEAMNIIIKKQASKGYENSPTVILQGHMDMVCEKRADVEHDFAKDPIKLRIEGELIKASGTTLGADNGIAVAYCLAILASNGIEHPTLEALFTTEEETGMSGAANVKNENLSGKILINIDSEEEGELLSSCAGGVRNRVKLFTEYEKVKDGFTAYTLKVKGLKGGHSGMEIDKGRANANKLIGRVLNDLKCNVDLYIAEISGGAKMNAIPREAETVILIKSEEETLLEKLTSKWQKIFKNEFRISDSEITIKLEKAENKKDNKSFTKELSNKIISLLMLIPQGVQSMSMDIEGLVQSSTNLGVVTTTENKVSFESAIRSSVRSLKYEIVKRIEIAANLVGAEMTLESEYPEWQYKANSRIRDIFVKIHKDMYGKEPKITAIHAGLECGLLKDILGDIDMVSFGPNMYDVHTPEESLSILSTKRTFEYLLNVLKEIK
ncbi:aminoacyl-histidine dipeptidase [Clostridium aestuarii]|uniref:Aminoacyl-histidine dipeptidase n=1 Tax=Clostridium aestuarii TaxID=338193 RepID=A0ABT4D141_9CLOT|nr:aminoacyl-histidine dipeptidase [Clostridium aestuarii]